MQSIRNRVKIAVVVTCLLLVQAASLTPAQASVATEISAAQRNDVLKELAKQLEARYAFPETAKKLAQAIRAKQRVNAYKDIFSAPELARVLTADLFEVAHDKHLRVNYSYVPLPPLKRGPPPPDFLAQIAKLNGMIPKVKILDGNVGYMRVNGVPPLAAARDSVAAAFAFLKRTDALIIDNRGNGGGDPNTVALYMSYLSEGEPYVVNTFHAREGNQVTEFKTTNVGDLSYGAKKPVFVLSSPGTFSGGEEMTYDIQAFKRGVVVGEVTGGGANPGGPVPLVHQFVVNMPNAYPKNPVTGTNWEGVGVKPDVPAPASQALVKAHTLAVEKLIADAEEPQARAVLEAVAMKFDAIEDADSPKGARLENRQIVGTYVLQGMPGAAVTLLEKDGKLIQRVEGFPDVTLVPVKGNRYQPQGMGDEFATTLRVKDGRTQLLLEVPFGPPTIRVKQ